MRIAILGGGSVGGGVVDILHKRSQKQIEIVYLVVRDIGKKRDFDIPSGTVVTDNLDLVIADKTLDLVIELMGGTSIAWDVVRGCLERGVSVVTANKALISKHLAEIENILQSVKPSPAFMYEAAVCGGIPVIHTLIRGMAGDEIKSVFGVMNGSTNWMLDRMDREGVPYESLLVEAKNLGYLEADPSADILGWDARSKLCILARLAFGITLDEEVVYCAGIHTVSQADINYANSAGKKIKLLARAWRDSNNRVFAYVVPTMVPATGAVGNLLGATNCVCYEAKFSGSHAMVGSGAGRYPTANSVVSDVLAIYNERRGGGQFHGHFGFNRVTCDLVFDSDFCAKFYVRASPEAIAALSSAGIEYTRVDNDSVLLKHELSNEYLKRVLERHQVGSVIVVM